MEHLGVPITEPEVEDPGIYMDADTPSGLHESQILE